MTKRESKGLDSDEGVLRVSCVEGRKKRWRTTGRELYEERVVGTAKLRYDLQWPL